MEQKPDAESIGSERAAPLNEKITPETREAREEMEVPLAGPSLYASFLFSVFYPIFFSMCL
jgi:hypothetical protein